MLVPDHHRISTSLEIEPAHGHTLGHAMLRLASQAEEASFSGDCFHHPLQLIDCDVQFGDCDDRDLASATRRRLVELALEREALIIPAHLPAPHAGRLRRDGHRLWFQGLAAVSA